VGGLDDIGMMHYSGSTDARPFSDGPMTTDIARSEFMHNPELLGCYIAATHGGSELRNVMTLYLHHYCDHCHSSIHQKWLTMRLAA